MKSNPADSLLIRSLNRKGSRKTKLRNLLKRGRVWYWKKMVNGSTLPVSLKTDNEALAIAKRDLLEAQMVSGELAKLREVKAAGSLEDIFTVYDRVAALTPKAMAGNKRALELMVETVTGKAAEPKEISLAAITDKLVRDYQDAMRTRYVAEAGPDAKAQREARDRAERSSKSMARQARSLFARKLQLIERYREAGIVVPACVEAFRDARAVGSATTKVYFPPSDAMLAATFAAIEAQRDLDRPLFDLFWTALATGCRRNELLDLRPDHFVEIDGMLWINGGQGKDGRTIQIPLVNWPVHPASATVPSNIVRELIEKAKADQRAWLFSGTDHERTDLLPRRLNAWLLAQGFADEKKLHALRAFIGSVLYGQNPRLAQKYLRHKSVSTTEQFYTHFLELSKVTQFQVVKPDAPKAQPKAA